MRIANTNQTVKGKLWRASWERIFGRTNKVTEATATGVKVEAVKDEYIRSTPDTPENTR